MPELLLDCLFSASAILFSRVGFRLLSISFRMYHLIPYISLRLGSISLYVSICISCLLLLLISMPKFGFHLFNISLYIGLCVGHYIPYIRHCILSISFHILCIFI